MDQATRAFALLAGSAAAAYIVLGFWGCAALVETLAAVSNEGFDVGRAGRDFGPALALAVVELTVALVGITSLNRQLVATERLARWVRRHIVDAPAALTAVAGLRRHLRSIDVVDAPGLVSFTYGFLRPRIVLSRELIDVSTPEELAAVVEHERYHARSFDPLKLAIARAVPAAFFFLPVLGDLRDRYILGRELAADRRAAARCGVQPLASALARATMTPPALQPAAGAALGGGQLRARVEQLETGVAPAPGPISRLVAGVSALSAVAVISLVAVSRGVGAGGGAHMHAPPLGSDVHVASMVATTLCLLFWGWVFWRLVRWQVARRRAIYYR